MKAHNRVVVPRLLLSYGWILYVVSSPKLEAKAAIVYNYHTKKKEKKKKNLTLLFLLYSSTMTKSSWTYSFKFYLKHLYCHSFIYTNERVTFSVMVNLRCFGGFNLLTPVVGTLDVRTCSSGNSKLNWVRYLFVINTRLVIQSHKLREVTFIRKKDLWPFFKKKIQHYNVHFSIFSL